jgi:hypothetical protein
MEPQQTQPPQQQLSQQPSPSNDEVFQAFIPTKNKSALLAYYFGIFGIIPIIGLPFAIAAIVLGYKGMALYKSNPTPGAKGHAMTGLVLGWVSIALWLLFIIVIFIPALLDR